MEWLEAIPPELRSIVQVGAALGASIAAGFGYVAARKRVAASKQGSDFSALVKGNENISEGVDAVVKFSQQTAAAADRTADFAEVCARELSAMRGDLALIKGAMEIQIALWKHLPAATDESVKTMVRALERLENKMDIRR